MEKASNTSSSSGPVQNWLFEHNMKLSNICVLVTEWVTATDRVSQFTAMTKINCFHSDYFL